MLVPIACKWPALTLLEVWALFTSLTSAAEFAIEESRGSLTSKHDTWSMVMPCGDDTGPASNLVVSVPPPPGGTV